jgi:hypothetical protein
VMKVELKIVSPPIEAVISMTITPFLNKASIITEIRIDVSHKRLAKEESHILVDLCQNCS